jgi:hypothetical protein
MACNYGINHWLSHQDERVCITLQKWAQKSSKFLARVLTEEKLGHGDSSSTQFLVLQILPVEKRSLLLVELGLVNHGFVELRGLIIRPV